MGLVSFRPLSILLALAIIARNGTVKGTNIDYEGCFSDMSLSDANGDGFLAREEYLPFIQKYGKRVCWAQESSLTLEQSAAFNTIACWCHETEGATDDCCIGANARISNAGAALDPDARTTQQLDYLTEVCTMTDSTMKNRCEKETIIQEAPENKAEDQEVVYTVSVHICDDEGTMDSGSLRFDSDSALPLCFVSDQYPNSSILSLYNLILSEHDENGGLLNTQQLVVQGHIPVSLESYLEQGENGAALDCSGGAIDDDSRHECIKYSIKVWQMFDSLGGTLLSIEGTVVLEVKDDDGSDRKLVRTTTSSNFQSRLLDRVKFGDITKMSFELPRLVEETLERQQQPDSEREEEFNSSGTLASLVSLFLSWCLVFLMACTLLI